MIIFLLTYLKKMNNFLDVLNTFTGVLPPTVPPEVPKDYDGRIPNDTSLMKNQPLQLGSAGDNYTYALDTSASDEFFKFGRRGSAKKRSASRKRSAKKSSRNYLLTTKKRMPRLSKRKTKRTTKRTTKRRVSHKKKTSFGRKRRTVKKYLFGSDMNATKAPTSSGNGLIAPYFGGEDYFNRPPEWFLPISNNKLQIPNFKPF
jgi:hypothetical protein